MISDATINIEPAVIELDLGHPRQNVCFVSAKSELMHRSKQHRYSITSSARKSMLGGTVSPSAEAVFELTINSNAVAC